MKTQILSDSDLWENSSACVKLFQESIIQKEAESPNMTIAAVGQYHPHHKEGNASHNSKFNKKSQSSFGSGQNSEVANRYYNRLSWILSLPKNQVCDFTWENQDSVHKKAKQDKFDHKTVAANVPQTVA